MEAEGDVNLEFLCEYLANAAEGEGFQLVSRADFVADWPGMRYTYSLNAPRADVLMQAVVTIAESSFPDEGAAAVELEELRFLTPDGILIAAYGLAYALDDQRCSTRAIRLADGTGFGQLQSQPLSQLQAHMATLRAAAGKQPLRTAAGRWSDSLLLLGIHIGVTCNFCPQA